MEKSFPDSDDEKVVNVDSDDEIIKDDTDDETFIIDDKVEKEEMSLEMIPSTKQLLYCSDSTPLNQIFGMTFLDFSPQCLKFHPLLGQNEIELKKILNQDGILFEFSISKTILVSKAILFVPMTPFYRDSPLSSQDNLEVTQGTILPGNIKFHIPTEKYQQRYFTGIMMLRIDLI